MDCIYLDNNATSPLLPAVHEAMRPFLAGFLGNPASAHRFGRRARQALEDARERIADLLGARADEVLFTSGATEANNLALFGLAGDPPGHLLASPIEHPSVSEPLRHLAARGFAIDYLPVGQDGCMRANALIDLLRPDTRLVTIMLVNHETGAIQPVQTATRPTGEPLLFHCDAVQAAGKIPFDFHALGVTTLSVSAHKFHGPVGIGALLVRQGTRLRPLLHGGHQQQGRRPGTEPVALAVGFATALALAAQEREMRLDHVRRLRQLLLEYLRQHAAPLVVNGSETCSPYTLNVSFPGVAADMLLIALDLEGVACATGSACSSGSLLPSPVLQAMNVPGEVLRSAMRFSFSSLLGEDEVHQAAQRISRVVNRLRHDEPRSNEPRTR
jgi:cysteine desulfurase